MAESSDFGARLRAARTQQGMSLDEAGRRLRIEPKVLDTIESQDFENMPPKYMTRSMVNAYAQLLGLNATTMTRDFLDAEFQYQLSRGVGGIYDNSQANNQISTRVAKPSAVAAAAAAYDKSGVSAQRPTFENGQLPSTTSNVSYRTSNTPAASVGSVWGKDGISRVGSALSSDSGRQRVSMNDDTAAGRKNVRRNADGSIRRPHFTALEDPDVQYDAAPAAAISINSQPRRDFSRLFMIVGCVLAVVLICVLIKIIFVPESGTSVDPTQAVSGLTDPEQTGISTSSSTTTRTPIKPTAAYFSIQVGDDTVWLDLYTASGNYNFLDSNGEINVGGATLMYSYYVEPGTRLQYDVTEKMYVRTNNPNIVTLTVNGERVDWKRAGWRWYYVVDFPAILEQWEKDNAVG